MPPRRITLKRTDIWREGKWLDLWSVVHFLSGLSTGLILSRFAFGFIPTLVIAVLLFIGYEFWEALEQIAETPQNRVMDVLVGTTSFIAVYLLKLNQLATHQFVSILGIILASNLILATLGWYASQKAAALERKLRHGMNVRRAKLVAARERLMRRQREEKDEA